MDNFKQDVYKYIEENFTLTLEGLYALCIRKNDVEGSISPEKVFDYIEENFMVDGLEELVEEAYQEWIDMHFKGILETPTDEGTTERIISFINKKYDVNKNAELGLVEFVDKKITEPVPSEQVYKKIMEVFGIDAQECSKIIRSIIEC